MRIATAVLAALLGALPEAAADPPCCQTIATAVELHAAFAAATDGVVHVCASADPIVWDETATLDALGRIYLNDDNDADPSVNPLVSSFELACVAADENDERRCVVDLSPSDAYDEATAYGGFVLQNQRQLVVDGFEFTGHRGQNEIFYNQDGSTQTIRNSVFTDNGSNAPTGKTPVIVYADDTTSGFATTIIENTLFAQNKGPLLGFQASNAILKNNVFYDNTLPENFESVFTYTAFINWQAYGTASTYTDNTLKIEGNHFVSFQAPASSGAHDKFWMIAAGGATTANLFANVTESTNCASNNDVAGNYSAVNIQNCTSGVYGAGPVYPDRVCLPFTGTCPDYASTPPEKPILKSFCESTRRYFLLEDDCKALDFDPIDSSVTTLIDTTSPAANLSVFTGDDLRTSSGTNYTGVAPSYYHGTDSNCQPPTSDEDPDAIYPGQGCTCFLPGDGEVSYFDMMDQSDANNHVTGYETAFDTSVSGGVSIAGWFKAADTGSDDWPGQQTSLIFIRGQKATWKHGYNFGLDKWRGWQFEVVLKGPGNTSSNRLRASSPGNSYPGVDQWHYVVGIYDAEKGRISIYVDNEHVASNYAPATYSRSARDIQWKRNGNELDFSRIGNGYDSNSKNFRGCTGGFQVYGKALQVTTQNPKVTTDEWKVAGNGVSFPSNTEVLMQSNSPFGVLLTKYAFNGRDVDFMVDYTQTEYGSGWQSKFYIFFVRTGTQPESLLLDDGNEAGAFEALTAGYLASKINTGIETTTYFNCGTASANCKNDYDPTVSTKYLSLSLRLRRLNNIVYAYYRAPDGDDWVRAGRSMSLPEALNDVPLHFGLRVMRNYQTDGHNFTVATTQLAGGPPLEVPTEGPTASPTEKIGRDMAADEWMFDGGDDTVSFRSNGSYDEVLLQSSSSHRSAFGVVLSKKAYNGSDVDFQVEFNQTEFLTDSDNAYESRLGIFFAPWGTYPDALLQPDIDIDEFYSKTVGYLRSKVHATIDATWFDSCHVDERGAGCCTQFIANKERTLELTLRLRRYNNAIEQYYKLPGKGWVLLQVLGIPAQFQEVPLQVGFRVEKDYKANHEFVVRPTQLAGGDPLDIPAAGSTPLSIRTGPQCPTKSPTESPTMNPTESPTKNPTESPTKNPTESPTMNPTESPTKNPTESPSKNPTKSPTTNPTNSPAEPDVSTTTMVKVLQKLMVPKSSHLCHGKPTCWLVDDGPVSVNIIEGLPGQASAAVLESGASVHKSIPPAPFTPVSHRANDSASYHATSTIGGLDISKEVRDGKVRMVVFTKEMKNGVTVSTPGKTWAPGSGKKRALRSLVEGADDLSVDMPESFMVDEASNSTTIPLVFTSNADTDMEIDVCMYAPEGYQLDSVLDEHGTPIQEDPISCIHVILQASDVTFLFEMSEFAGGRMLKGGPPAERTVANLSVKLKGRKYATKIVGKGKGVQKKANMFG